MRYVDEEAERLKGWKVERAQGTIGFPFSLSAFQPFSLRNRLLVDFKCIVQ
jgi:hypothetical protein